MLRGVPYERQFDASSRLGKCLDAKTDDAWLHILTRPRNQLEIWFHVRSALVFCLSCKILLSHVTQLVECVNNAHTASQHKKHMPPGLEVSKVLHAKNPSDLLNLRRACQRKCHRAVAAEAKHLANVHVQQYARLVRPSSAGNDKIVSRHCMARKQSLMFNAFATATKKVQPDIRHHTVHITTGRACIA